jgi:hypothetical protein
LNPPFQAKYPHPEAPFRIRDALCLLAIVVAALLFARRVQQRRKRSE